MTINSIGQAIATTDIASSDTRAILTALRGYSGSNLLKAYGSATDSVWAQLQRAASVRDFDNLISRLKAMPDTPDGSGKIVGTFSAGAEGVPSQQLPDSTLMTDLERLDELGLALPTQAWHYTGETAAAPGVAADMVLMSPQDIARIQAECPLAFSQDGVDYYARTTGSGSQTTYVAVYTNEGAYCANDSDITALGSRLEDELDEANTLLIEGSRRLTGVAEAFHLNLEDLGASRMVKVQQQQHEERHIETLLGLPKDEIPPL